MRAELALTLRGDLPDNLQVGDALTLTGVVTVHTIHSDLVDVTSMGGNPTYLPTVAEVGVYANEIKLAKAEA